MIQSTVKWERIHRLAERAGVEIFFATDNNRKNNFYLLHGHCFQARCSGTWGVAGVLLCFANGEIQA